MISHNLLDNLLAIGLNPKWGGGVRELPPNFVTERDSRPTSVEHTSPSGSISEPTIGPKAPLLYHGASHADRTPDLRDRHCGRPRAGEGYHASHSGSNAGNNTVRSGGRPVIYPGSQAEPVGPLLLPRVHHERRYLPCLPGAAERVDELCRTGTSLVPAICSPARLSPSRNTSSVPQNSAQPRATASAPVPLTPRTFPLSPHRHCPHPPPLAPPGRSIATGAASRPPLPSRGPPARSVSPRPPVG